jgi:integrase
MTEFSHGNVHRRDWTHAGKKRSAYEFSFTYTKDGATRRARGQAATRAEALEAMEARKAELAKEPEVAPPATVTLNEYADRWLVEIASSVEPRTVESYRGMLKNHVRPELGALALPSITRGQVKSLLAKKREAGLSKDTVRLIRAAISALFSDAVDSELVPWNPAAKIGRARGRKSPDSVSTSERRQNIKAMSGEQLETFLKAAARERLGLLFLFLADTGVRPGEAFALRWPEVDIMGRQVHIKRAIARGKRIKDTKTNTDRYVDLTPRLAKALDVYQTQIEKKALETGREAPDLVSERRRHAVRRHQRREEVQGATHPRRVAEAVLALHATAHVRLAPARAERPDHVRRQPDGPLEADDHAPVLRPLRAARGPRPGRPPGGVADGAGEPEERCRADLLVEPLPPRSSPRRPWDRQPGARRFRVGPQGSPQEPDGG